MLIPVDSLDDPRVDPYRNMKDRDLAREGNRFIVESEQVVRRFLASDFPVESALIARRRVDELSPLFPASIPVYVISDELMTGILGFKFHSGVLACGMRKPRLTIDHLLDRLGAAATLMVLPEVANTENLGSLIRIAAGFGVDAMLLGPQSCDPFYRQAIRVSMGTVFRMPLVQSADLSADLARLGDAGGFELVATVLDPSAEPLNGFFPASRSAILFGNEAQGLPADLVQRCDRRVTIPMQLGTDSLNVAIAAAVVLYHVTTVRR